MMRTANDNDLLLAACERAHRALTIGAAFGLFTCIGALWYVVVGLRAGGAL
ncbi:hypothetical protein [Burkholderia sp. ABCPW 14]|uniref:hypothetical protein n=1 Tax=Burkholderia sp. ABCPW 14 TaxID=1637860 RepID=UPI000AAB1F45|nr:hypothetical protein [Burkholderia sp. ABCPW 14]